MRWLPGITDSRDTSLSKAPEGGEGQGSLPSLGSPRVRRDRQRSSWPVPPVAHLLHTQQLCVSPARPMLLATPLPTGTH